jgi:hypothetical protein
MEASDPCHNIVGNGTSHLRSGICGDRKPILER